MDATDTMTRERPEVLVVGAGPVGLTAAHELLRRGIRVRLVAAAEGPAVTSRALATHARSLEIYDQMGILPGLLPRGQVVQAFTLYQNGRRLARLGADYSELPTRFPMTLMVDQTLTEEALRTAVTGLGGTIEWGVRLDSLEQDGHGVRALLTHPDGRSEEVASDWLVGCDGGHSTVRKQLGLQLIGSSSETWLIADAEVDADLPKNSLYWLRTPGGTIMAVPFPDRNRWRLLDTHDTDDADPEAVRVRFEEKLAAGLGRPVRVSTPTWVSAFTIQQRMLPGMRKGRCFVAGDAAHVHSPASGQGMNTGIQDAYNLGWKLASVIRGHADESLLDSYSDERVPVGAALLGSTNRATSLIQLKHPVAGVLVPLMFKAVTSVRPLRTRLERKIMGGMSALGLDYAGSPLTASAPATDGQQQQQPQPVPGMRVSRVAADRAGSGGWPELLAELRRVDWTLLVFGDAGDGVARQLDAEYGAWLSVRTVGGDGGGHGHLADPDGLLAGDLGARPGGWLLVRPDGYLAARGEVLTADVVAGHAAAYAGRRTAARREDPQPLRNH
ncbi:FAD-dependent monooxygenase (plasmid) [Streptomyces sp. NBC_00435]|uniref:FAD-dependent monooxygenase n=1 Tax=Streptomyces sp. NBC_00435 TaxID=2903649 RepID=UPI002E20C3E3